MAYSDFIIYADESGSPNLLADQTDFPVFVLVFMIVRKRHYTDVLVPSVQRLKFEYTGHDQIILHERDIRRQSGAFAFLQVSADLRERFLERIGEIIGSAEIGLACSIIDKNKLRKQYLNPWSPYDLALTFCVEKAAKVLRDRGESDSQINVVFEARGRTEDQHLELEFRRITTGQPRVGAPSAFVTGFQWSPVFVDKRANSTGLQIADLAARPLGLDYLRPGQPNRAVEALKGKVVFPHPKVFP